MRNTVRFRGDCPVGAYNTGLGAMPTALTDIKGACSRGYRTAWP